MTTTDDESIKGFKLKIPNIELVQELENKLVKFYRTEIGINLNPAIHSLKEIMNEKSDEILEKLKEFKKSLQDILDLFL